MGTKSEKLQLFKQNSWLQTIASETRDFLYVHTKKIHYVLTTERGRMISYLDRSRPKSVVFFTITQPPRDNRAWKVTSITNRLQTTLREGTQSNNLEWGTNMFVYSREINVELFIIIPVQNTFATTSLSSINQPTILEKDSKTSPPDSTRCYQCRPRRSGKLMSTLLNWGANNTRRVKVWRSTYHIRQEIDGQIRFRKYTS